MARKKVSIDESGESLKPEKKGTRKKKFESEKRYNMNFVPKTTNQQIAWNMFKEKSIVVLSGSAGGGKTFLGTFYAMQELSKGNYERLIITRNAIGCGKSIGFFPGDISEKLSAWCAQVLSFCKQFVGTEVVENWMRGPNPKIILEPMEVIRGRSYENSIIIVEEAQLCSIQDLKCLTTRIGKDSLMILNGDPVQKDIKDSGLETFCKLVKDYHIDDIGVVKFTVDDILRHDVVRQLVIAFQKEGI